VLISVHEMWTPWCNPFSTGWPQAGIPRIYP
jgi:hypothetical protein